MMTTTRSIAAALLVGLASAGCVVAPVGPRYGYADDPTVVGVEPPPPQYEVVGVAPAVGMVWLAGYWAWAGSRYAWRPGHWARPHPGHYWEPHRWERGRGGWVSRGGQWRRR